MPERPALPSAGSEHEPMPVFVLKAKDHLAAPAIEEYRRLCVSNGLDDQAAEVEKAFWEVVRWRANHPDECKWPDHEHRAAGLPGSGSDCVA